MAADFGKLAKEVIPHLGGAENIVGVVHCATRLRFELRDYGKADVEKLKSAYGVISAFHKGGYMQLVIGNKVAECYKVVVAELAGQNVVVADGGAPEQKPKEPMSLGKVGRVIKSLPSRFISTCSAVFTPVMLMIAAAGILWGIFNIFTTAGVDPDGDFATLWGMMADGPLLFLPILLGFSAGKKFGANPYLTASIGACLIAPYLYETVGITLTVAGIPFKIIGYAKSVLPILIAAYVASLLEKFFDKVIPSVVKSFLTPMLVLLIVVPLTFGILGPVFTGISDGLAWVYGKTQGTIAGRAATGLIIGAVWQLVVMFGFHHAFNGIDQININSPAKFSSLWTYREMSVASQTGAALGVYLKMKDKKERGATLANVVTGVFGVTEPLLYGTTLPRKKVFGMGMIGGAIGGLLAGIIGGGIFVQGGWGILSLLSGIDKDGIQGPAFGKAFFGALAGMVLAFAVATILVVITHKEKRAALSVQSDVPSQPDNQETTQAQSKETDSQSNASSETLVLVSPLKGTVVAQSESKDPAFALEAVGKGVIVVPTEGRLYAPCDGVIEAVFETKHMIGLKANDATEIILHLGIDTVKLGGQHFDVQVAVGDKVTKGDLLVMFDIEAIKEKGYSLDTPLLLCNTKNPQGIRVVPTSGSQIEIGDVLIEYVH